METLQTVYEEKYKTAVHLTELLIPDWDGVPIHITANETRSKLIASLEAKQNKLDRERQNLHLINGTTLESIVNAYEKAKANLNELNEKLNQIQANVEALEEDCKARRAKWVVLLKNCSIMVQTLFNEYLQQKRFSGMLTFRHKDLKLELSVQTDANDKNTRHTDIRGTSGGERSYTTLCLLLALGNVVCY